MHLSNNYCGAPKEMEVLGKRYIVRIEYCQYRLLKSGAMDVGAIYLDCWIFYDQRRNSHMS